MDSERFEAIGQRGEACIILVTQRTLPSGQTEAVYTLATGERLRPTEAPGEYATLNGSRVFRLRPRPGKDATAPSPPA